MAFLVSLSGVFQFGVMCFEAVESTSGPATATLPSSAGRIGFLDDSFPPRADQVDELNQREGQLRDEALPAATTPYDPVSRGMKMHESRDVAARNPDPHSTNRAAPPAAQKSSETLEDSGGTTAIVKSSAVTLSTLAVAGGAGDVRNINSASAFSDASRRGSASATPTTASSSSADPHLDTRRPSSDTSIGIDSGGATASSAAQRSSFLEATAGGKIDVDTTVTLSLGSALIGNTSSNNSSNNSSNTSASNATANSSSPAAAAATTPAPPTATQYNPITSTSPLHGITTGAYDIYGVANSISKWQDNGAGSNDAGGLGGTEVLHYDLLRDERKAVPPRISRETTEAVYHVVDRMLSRNGVLVRGQEGRGEVYSGHNTSDAKQVQRRTAIVLNRMNAFSEYRPNPLPATDPWAYASSADFQRELIIRDDKYRKMYNAQMLTARRQIIDTVKHDPARAEITQYVGKWNELKCAMPGNVIPLRTFVTTRVPMLQAQANSAAGLERMKNFRLNDLPIRQLPLPEEPCLPKTPAMINGNSKAGQQILQDLSAAVANQTASSNSSTNATSTSGNTSNATGGGNASNGTPFISSAFLQDVAVDTVAEMSWSTTGINGGSDTTAFQALTMRQTIPTMDEEATDGTVQVTNPWTGEVVDVALLSPEEAAAAAQAPEYSLDYAGLAFHNVLLPQDCWMLCAQYPNCAAWKYSQCTNEQSLCQVTAGNCFLYDTTEVAFVPQPPDRDSGTNIALVDQEYLYGFRYCLEPIPAGAFDFVPWLFFVIMLLICCMFGTMFRVTREKPKKGMSVVDDIASRHEEEHTNKMRDLNTLRWDPKLGFVEKEKKGPAPGTGVGPPVDLKQTVAPTTSSGGGTAAPT
eukprot:CAMPEP_0178987124 /NCGR_PEP_ID=MMETSP0795-20121207/3086_1 /TAXON_ID=88552 /ORGANISM="Amoebophrya sp., Strain Ameob2" /LENGTH=866 /DNA_ID=CAMNT_0020678263 /DNA_START=141 /DNA_END=2741 /DNA_ORIENTATION=-